jgi:hypothetical protein
MGWIAIIVIDENIAAIRCAGSCERIRQSALHEEKDDNMNKIEQLPTKRRSILVGAFILIAYGILVSTLTESPMVVMVADVVSGIAVIGIAVLMFPLFREHNQILSYCYLILKWVEGLLMVAAGGLYLNPPTQGFRDTVYNGIHLYVFIISGAIFYILLYRRRLIPRYISIWGMAGIGALAVSTLLTLVGRPLAFLDYFLVLIITNEVFLAIWLFIKGLDSTDTDFGTRKI